MCRDVQALVFCNDCGDLLESLLVHVTCRRPKAKGADGRHPVEDGGQRSFQIDRCPTCQLNEEHEEQLSREAYIRKKQKLREEMKETIEEWLDGIRTRRIP